MKKIFLSILIISILIVPDSIASAQNKGLRVTPRNFDELKMFIDSRNSSLNKELEAMDEVKAQVHKNQNKLIAGAQNLMIMENMLNSSGEEVRELAEEINTISKKTLVYEESILKRNKFKKFLFGQDGGVINNYYDELEKQKNKISRLKEILKECECSNEIKGLFRNELSLIENEYSRQELYHQDESSKKGILTWIINIFK